MPARAAPGIWIFLFEDKDAISKVAPLDIPLVIKPAVNLFIGSYGFIRTQFEDRGCRDWRRRGVPHEQAQR
jgi:hypothetical protein